MIDWALTKHKLGNVDLSLYRPKVMVRCDIPNTNKVLISFASPGDGHSGIIYKAANWDFVGETIPSYFYLNKDGWKIHKRTLYNQARSAHLTELEFAQKFKYEKIHMPPLRKYIYIKDKRKKINAPT